MLPVHFDLPQTQVCNWRLILLLADCTICCAVTMSCMQHAWSNSSGQAQVTRYCLRLWAQGTSTLACRASQLGRDEEICQMRAHWAPRHQHDINWWDSRSRKTVYQPNLAVWALFIMAYVQHKAVGLVRSQQELATFLGTYLNCPTGTWRMAPGCST